MAGLVPATPIMWHGRAKLSGVARDEPGDDAGALFKAAIVCDNVISSKI
jgi:hypothetical protein